MQTVMPFAEKLAVLAALLERGKKLRAETREKIGTQRFQVASHGQAWDTIVIVTGTLEQPEMTCKLIRRACLDRKAQQYPLQNGRFSSHNQTATFCIAPYAHLKDMHYVSIKPFQEDTLNP